MDRIRTHTDCLLGSHVGEGIDFATITMGTDTAADLLACTLDHEPGHGRPGFARSEQRLCLGGTIWRRWDPHQSSERWGTDYESWEASSGESRWFASWARGRPVRPSRIDVAFDFEVALDRKSDDVVASILDPSRPTHTREGFSIGVSGQGGTNTHYVGSSESERRLRIYRRDLKDPILLHQLGHPVLRVELVMKGDHARAWWPVWESDPAAAFAAAAAHVRAMSGLVVRADVGTVPALVDPPPAADAAQFLMHFLDQHGATLLACADSGIDVFGLAAERVALAAQRTRERGAHRSASFQTIGGAEIERAVRCLLAWRSRTASA